MMIRSLYKIPQKMGKINYSTQSSVQLTIDETTRVAKLKMFKPPVNTLNTNFLKQLADAIKEAEDSKCKGLLLTSNVPGIFSAGIDLLELYNTNEERLGTFWKTLQDTWFKLYTSPMAVVALINGHSPAGGCLLAMSCDYRIMLGSKFAIGLNEAKIGVPAPFWFMDVMASLIGQRITENSVISGKMYKAEEALRIGLIDEIASDITDADTKANLYFNSVISCPAECRAMMKQELRNNLVKKFVLRRDEDVSNVIKVVTNPRTQKMLGMYLESLNK